MADAKAVIEEFLKNQNLSNNLKQQCELMMLVLDKNYNDALSKISSEQPTHDAIYKAQIQIESGKTKDGIQTLIQHVVNNKMKDSRLVAFLFIAATDGNLLMRSNSLYS